MSHGGDGMFGWFKAISAQERRTFWACFGG